MPEIYPPSINERLGREKQEFERRRRWYDFKDPDEMLLDLTAGTANLVKDIRDDIEAYSTPFQAGKEEVKDFESRKKEKEADRFLYYSKDFENLMNYLGYEDAEPLYGKLQIIAKPEVRKFREIADSIERLKYLDQLEAPAAVACLYSLPDEMKIPRILRIQDRMKKYFLMTRDPKYASEVSPESLKRGLKRDVLRYAMLGTPELAIYKKAARYCEEDKISTNHLVKLHGYGAGVPSYEFLRKVYDDARAEVEKNYREKDLSADQKDNLAVKLGAKWLRKSLEYNDPKRVASSSYVSGPEEAVAWARLHPRTGDRLLKLRRGVPGIDLHNIGRFIGKSEPHKSLDKAFFKAKESLDAFSAGSTEESQKLINELTAVEDENFRTRITKIEREAAEDAREIWEKVKSKSEAKDQLRKSSKHFEKKENQLRGAHFREIGRLKKLSQTEIKEILTMRLEKARRKRDLERPISEKALFLQALEHRVKRQKGAKFASNVDWVNSASFGLINRCYRMHFESVPDEELLGYARVSQALGENLKYFKGDQVRLLCRMPDDFIFFVARKIRTRAGKEKELYKVADLEEFLEQSTFKGYYFQLKMEDYQDLRKLTGLDVAWNEQLISNLISKIFSESQYQDFYGNLELIEELMGERIFWTQEIFDGFAKKFFLAYPIDALRDFHLYETKSALKAKLSQENLGFLALELGKKQILTLLPEYEAYFGQKVRWTDKMAEEIAGSFDLNKEFQKNVLDLEKISGREVSFTDEFVASQAISFDFVQTFQTLRKEEYQKRLQSMNFLNFIKKAFALQAPAANARYCPWRQDLRSLVSDQSGKNNLVLENKPDQELFLKYLREIGPFNLPRLFPLFFELNRKQKVADLAEETKNLLVQFGVKVDKFTRTSEILNDLKQRKRKMTEELLAEKVPTALRSVLGEEIYRSLVGSSTWESGRKLGETADLCEKASRANPKNFALPEGYEAKTVKVRKQAAISESETVDKGEKLKALMAEKSTTDLLKNELRPIEDAFTKASEVSLESWWSSARENVRKFLEGAITDSKKNLEKIPEAGRAGLLKQIENYENLLSFSIEFKFPEKTDEISCLKAMEALSTVSLKKGKVIADTLRVLSCFHLLQTMPAYYRENFLEILRQAAESTALSVRTLDDFTKDYLNEHYFDPSKDPAKTYHEPFSDDLRRILKGLFGLTGDFNKRPLGLLRQKIEAIEGAAELSQETAAVKLVPARKMLRVSSGTIGDACYAKHDAELAEGQWPEITALIFVTSPETAAERFNGSVLLIETMDAAGNPVMLVRANNPSENLLCSVDIGELMRETFNYAIEVAKKRGLKKVVIPLDASHASCSNRDKVADYYHENFSNAPRIMLRNAAETNFNGYPNWNANGAYPCVEIWRA